MSPRRAMAFARRYSSARAPQLIVQSAFQWKPTFTQAGLPAFDVGLWFGLLAPGGMLVTFSCSGAIDEALFQKVVFGAALDAKRDAWIIGKLTQASDHPVALTFPEAAYLKGLVVRAA